jgi:hypothetical protein
MGGKKMVSVNGISVIIPAFSSIDVTSNSVISVVKQQLGKTNRPKVDLILMNDDIENPHKYDYFLSDDFRSKFYDYNKNEVSIRIVDNRKYMADNNKLFQGGSRLFGMLNEAKYDYCILLDDDDVLSPNAVRMYTDILNKEMENAKANNKEIKISTVGAIFRSFDEGCNQNDIGKDQFSIWVQGRLWNRQFLIENNINDTTLYKNKINRRQGEDYLFVSVFDYINSKQPEWQRILTKDFICGFWIPNYNSLSRQDPFYGQHLAGSTMSSSYTIYEYMKAFSKTPADDEELKQRLLNMTIYSMYNLYDFIITVASTSYEPKQIDWYLLRDYCKKLKEALKEYYDEIQENDIVVTNADIITKSDCRVHNLFEGSFFDYMNKEVRWFDYDYDKMIQESKKLHYDGVNVLESKQCKAWRKRHDKN